MTDQAPALPEGLTRAIKHLLAAADYAAVAGTAYDRREITHERYAEFRDRLLKSRAALDSALGEYMKDAERYRFLRERMSLADCGDSGYWITLGEDIEANHFLTSRLGGAPHDVEEALDAAIAEARAARSPAPSDR